MFIGLNPAGNEFDAKRSKATESLFLNYYEEFDELDKLDDNWFCDKVDNENENKHKSFIYKKYFEAIYKFFHDILNKKEIAWEWCNCEFEKLIENIKNVRKDISKDERQIQILDNCYKKYNESKYQIIIRDLVYYHQTSGFCKILKKENDNEVKVIVKNILDSYINIFPDKKKLKLIYVNYSATCHYLEEALKGTESFDINKDGVAYYRFQQDNEDITIPIMFAGCALSGQRAIDKYSKIRLQSAVKRLLKPEEDSVLVKGKRYYKVD